MKRYLLILFAVGALAQEQAKFGPLTGDEKLEMLHLLDNYENAQAQVKKASDALEARLVKLRELHAAGNCKLSRALTWVECVTNGKGKSK